VEGRTQRLQPTHYRHRAEPEAGIETDASCRSDRGIEGRPIPVSSFLASRRLGWTQRQPWIATSIADPPDGCVGTYIRDVRRGALDEATARRVLEPPRPAVECLDALVRYVARHEVDFARTQERTAQLVAIRGEVCDRCVERNR